MNSGPRKSLPGNWTPLQGVLFFFLISAFCFSAAAQTTASGTMAWIWPTFDNATNTQLYIHVSADGLIWQTLNNAQPVLTVTNGCLRDPAIVKAHGIYYLAFTAGNYGCSGYFSLYQSTDLLNWTFMQNISTVSTGQNDSSYPYGNTWSPNWYLDGNGDDTSLDLTARLRLFVTVGKANDNPSSWWIYGMTPANQALTAFTTPTQVGFKTGGTSLSLNDLTVMQTGTTWLATYVDFSGNGNPFRSATTPGNPMTWGTGNAEWTMNGSVGFESPWLGQSVEGAFLIPTSTGSNWLIYGDSGNGGPGYRRGLFNPSTYTLVSNGLSGTNAFWGATAPVFSSTATIYRSGRPCFSSRPGWMISGSAYQTWQSRVFSGSQLSEPSISGNTATPAGDGVPNLMKYALSLLPFTQAATGLPTPGTTTAGGSNYLTLTFNQNNSATDITYYVEVSGDLVHWHSGLNYTTLAGPPTDNGNGTQKVVAQDLVPLAGSTGKRFIRLRVTKP